MNSKKKQRRINKWKQAQQEYESRASYNFMGQSKQGGLFPSSTE
jgi:hypothetical protein